MTDRTSWWRRVLRRTDDPASAPSPDGGSDAGFRVPSPVPADAGPAVAEAVASAPVVLFTRRGCHLCELALADLEPLCADRGRRVRTVDIDEDDDLRRAFTDDVPVVAVDGVPICRWRLDPLAVAAALDALRD